MDEFLATVAGSVTSKSKGTDGAAEGQSSWTVNGWIEALVPSGNDVDRTRRVVPELLASALTKVTLWRRRTLKSVVYGARTARHHGALAHR